MNRTLPLVIILLLVAVGASARKRSYQSGQLTEVVIKDIPTRILLNPEPAVAVGVAYEFHIREDDITNLAQCWTRTRRNYGSDWVLNDPVEFQVEKDKVFLKRPDDHELRLALLTRVRTVVKKDGTGTEQTSTQPLPPYASHQIVPECQ
jgi:hypothetical protein